MSPTSSASSVRRRIAGAGVKSSDDGEQGAQRETGKRGKGSMLVRVLVVSCAAGLLGATGLIWAGVLEVGSGAGGVLAQEPGGGGWALDRPAEKVRHVGDFVRPGRPGRPGACAPSDADNVTALLATSERYVLHVLTDKTIYRPGDVVHGRAVAFGALNGAPLADEASPGRWSVEVLDSSGTSQHWGYSLGRLRVPPSATGGTYELVVRQMGPVCAGSDFLVGPGTRSFEVRLDARSNAQLGGSLVLSKQSYSEGDVVEARLESLVDLSDGHPVGNMATAQVTLLDGPETVESKTLAVSDTLQVTLPAVLQSTSPLLSVWVQWGASSRTFTVPIPLARPDLVDVQFSTSSGGLLAGCPNEVYIAATSRATGEPIGVQGWVTERGGSKKRIAEVATRHEGRGKVRFTPRNGAKYVLRTDGGAEFALPGIIPPAQGVSLVLADDDTVASAGGSVGIRVCGNSKQPIKLRLMKREVQLSEATIPKGGGVAQLAVQSAHGVVRVEAVRTTSSSEEVRIVGEKLVFVQPASRVRVALSTPKIPTPPRSSVTLKIETDKPARVVVSVTDMARFDQVERRRRQPTLEQAALLEADIHDLTDASEYLGASGNVDLLLGTQRWRHFLYKEDELRSKWAARQGKEALRLARVLGIPDKFGGDRALKKHMAAFAMDMAMEDDMMLEAEAVDAAPVMMMARAAGGAPRNRMRGGAAGMAVRTAASVAPAGIDLGSDADERHELAETIYWDEKPVRTIKDVTTGKAFREVTIDVPDSLGTMRVAVEAWDEDGALGAASGSFQVDKRVSVDATLPVQATVGDELNIPVAVRSQDPTLAILGLTVSVNPGEDSVFDNAAPANTRTMVAFQPQEPGLTTVTLRAKGGEHSDAIKRAFFVVQQGVNVTGGGGGLLELGADGAQEVKVPVPGTLLKDAEHKVRITLQLSLSEAIMEVVESTIRTPCGCFEQTSSTTYPLVLALRLLTALDRRDPKVRELVKRSREMLREGYKRLASYESKTGGFEWFGGDPGHEALTAYGLLQFLEMRNPQLGLHGLVDEAMVQRTQKWLLGRRDGRGGFKRSPKALDSFGRAPEHTTNAYIAWSLARAGLPSTLRAEMGRLRAYAQNATFHGDAYLLALAANALQISSSDSSATPEDGDAALEAQLLGRLAGMQDEETGCVLSSGPELHPTITTRPSTRSHAIESTSLAVMAWLHAGGHVSNVHSGIGCISSLAKAGRYGATQATALALQALAAFNAQVKPLDSGLFTAEVNGRVREVKITDRRNVVLEETLASSELAGELVVRLSLTSDTSPGARVPFIVDTTLSAKHPDPHPDPALQLEVSPLPSGGVDEGSVLTMSATLTNTRADANVSMPLVSLGFGAGLEPDTDALRRLVDGTSSGVARYEVRPSQVLLYWRGLAAGASEKIAVPFFARHPGRFFAPAHSAFPFYDPDNYVFAGAALETLTIRPGTSPDLP